MRWPVRYYVPRWHRWFAWHPVKVGERGSEQRVWLEWIERKVEWHCDCPFTSYRLSVRALKPAFQCEPMHPDKEGWSEWIHPLPGYLMQCCDCGLIHEMEFAIGQADGDGPLNEGETREALILFRARRHCPAIAKAKGEDGEASNG